MSDLPIVQYRSHRTAYTIIAVLGLLIAFQSYFWFAYRSVFVGTMSLLIGLILSIRCGWMALEHSIILELNQEGIRYKRDFYGWNTLHSYAIQEEEGESGSFNYLVLRFKEHKKGLHIQLDWLENMDALKEQIAVYAEAFRLPFEGVIKKEI